MDAQTAQKTVKTVNDAVGTVSELAAFVENAKERSVNSLSEYAKKTLLSSRVYIEDVISGEAVVPSLMKMLNTIYASLCMIALNLNNLVTGGKTVRQYMTAVSTEEYHEIKSLIQDKFGDKVTEREISLEGAAESAAVKQKGTGASVHTADVKTDASHLFTGRLMEVTIGSGEHSAHIYFLVQLCPYILPGLVMEQFIINNTPPSSTLRWAQVKAGEIRFWKDFIFECDRVEKRRKALILDKEGILREVENHRNRSLWQTIKNFFAKTPDAVRRNVANSILILSKNKLEKYCKDLGLNIKNFNDRQKLMANTMSLIIVAYDPNYGTVDLYLNGIQNRGEYTDQMVQSFSKGGDDKVDIKQLMTIMMAGAAPRF